MTLNITYLREEYKPQSNSTYKWYWTRVDYNLDNISGQWYDYICKITEGIFKSQASGYWTYAKVDYILRIEQEIRACSPLECRSIIEKMDTYLSWKTVSDSPDKSFILHVRNKAFQRIENIRFWRVD